MADPHKEPRKRKRIKKMPQKVTVMPQGKEKKLSYSIKPTAEPEPVKLQRMYRQPYKD